MIEVEQERWLSTSEVTDALKISRSTLFAMRRAGTAPANVKLGRTLYYNERSLAEWLHGQEQTI